MDKGLSPVAAASAVAEKIPLDNLFAIASKSPTSLKQVVKNLLVKAAGVEAVGEITAEVIENAIDYCIYNRSGRGDFAEAVNALTKQGYSKEEARKAAFFQIGVINVALAGAGGFLSGLGLGGFAQVGGLVRNQRTGAAVLADYNGNTDIGAALVGEGLEHDVGSEGYESAAELSEKLAKGEHLNEAEIGRQFTANETDLQKERLTEALQERKEQIRRVIGLNDFAGSLGDNGKNALQLVDNGDVDTDALAAGFTNYYQAGILGTALHEVRAPYGDALTQEQKIIAYEAGQADAAATVKANRENRENTTASLSSSGLDFEHDDGYAANVLDKKLAVKIDDVSKALGNKVLFVDSVDGGKGNAKVGIEASEEGNRNIRVIRIEKNNPNPVMSLFGHEITHPIQKLAPAEYNAFRRMALDNVRWI